MKLSPTFRAQMRGNFALALIPLGLALIARGLEELDALVNARYATLADLESQIALRRNRDAHGIEPGEPEPEPPTAHLGVDDGCPPGCPACDLAAAPEPAR